MPPPPPLCLQGGWAAPHSLPLACLPLLPSACRVGGPHLTPFPWRASPSSPLPAGWVGRTSLPSPSVPPPPPLCLQGGWAAPHSLPLACLPLLPSACGVGGPHLTPFPWRASPSSPLPAGWVGHTSLPSPGVPPPPPLCLQGGWATPHSLPLACLPLLPSACRVGGPHLTPFPWRASPSSPLPAGWVGRTSLPSSGVPPPPPLCLRGGWAAPHSLPLACLPLLPSACRVGGPHLTPFPWRASPSSPLPAGWVGHTSLPSPGVPPPPPLCLRGGWATPHSLPLACLPLLPSACGVGGPHLTPFP